MLAAIVGLFAVYLGFGPHKDKAVALATPAPRVTVSQPLQREIDTRVGFLGQFSAVNRVELHAHFGGTLTEGLPQGRSDRPQGL